MRAARGILQSILGVRPRSPAASPRAAVGAWLTRARAVQCAEGGLQRRQRQRWQWTHLLIIRNGADEHEAVAADISMGGVGVLLPHSLDMGALVWLRDLRGSDWVGARVRHIEPTEDPEIYRVGMEFDFDAVPEGLPRPAPPR